MDFSNLSIPAHEVCTSVKVVRGGSRAHVLAARVHARVRVGRGVGWRGAASEVSKEGEGVIHITHTTHDTHDTYDTYDTYDTHDAGVRAWEIKSAAAPGEYSVAR